MKTALRLCRRCNTKKSPTEFYPGKNTWCKACNSARARERLLEMLPTQRFGEALPVSTNFRVEATASQKALLGYGTSVLQQRPAAYHALDVITSGWNRSEAR